MRTLTKFRVFIDGTMRYPDGPYLLTQDGTLVEASRTSETDEHSSDPYGMRDVTKIDPIERGPGDVMFFTGLTDQFGSEIWEGDIWFNYEATFLVRCASGSCYFQQLPDGKIVVDGLRDFAKTGRVVGNQWSDPHLVRGTLVWTHSMEEWYQNRAFERN